MDCPEQYIGESGRTFGDRFRVHLRAPSPIHQHSQSTGHPVDLECFTIIDREAQGTTRTIKEAMYIRVNDLLSIETCRNTISSHLWDEVLQDTPSLQLK